MGKELICDNCKQRIATETHHMIFGKNRSNSEKYKKQCTVRLCSDCHYRLHNIDEELARKYRRKAQEQFEEEYGHEKFMKVFGRNYL